MVPLQWTTPPEQSLSPNVDSIGGMLAMVRMAKEQVIPPQTSTLVSCLVDWVLGVQKRKVVVHVADVQGPHSICSCPLN